MNKKINYPILIAGVIMLIASVINYYLNDDFVSLGIFAFAGIGFILIGIKDTKDDKVAGRINKYAMTFFSISVIIIIYWLLAGKFKLL